MMKGTDNIIAKMYHSTSAISKATFWYLICNIVSKVSVLICTPAYTRLMSSQQYGEYSVWHSWTGVIAAFTTLNLFSSGFNAGLTHFADDKKGYMSAMVGLTTVLSIVGMAAVVIYLIICPGELYAFYYLLLVIEILFNAYFNFYAAYERYNHRYIKLLRITVVQVLLFVFLTTIPLFMVDKDYRFTFRICGEVITWLFVGTICFISIIRSDRQVYKIKYWKYGLKNNVLLIPHYLSGTILNQSDRIMIGKICGSREVAYYSLSYTISSMLLIVTTAIKSSFDPVLLKAIKKGNASELRRIILFLLMLMILLASLCMAIAPELLYLFAPSEYYSARFIIPSIVTSVFFIFAYGIFGCVSFYYQKSKEIMIISVFGALLNLALNYYLLPRFGYEVAGYTTLISYFFFALSHYVWAKHLLNSHGQGSTFDTIKIVSLFITMFLIMLLYRLIYNSVLLRYISVLLVLVIIFGIKDKIMEILRANFEND